jgi:hypothetical protein
MEVFGQFNVPAALPPEKKALSTHWLPFIWDRDLAWAL